MVGTWIGNPDELQEVCLCYIQLLDIGLYEYTNRHLTSVPNTIFRHVPSPYELCSAFQLIKLFEQSFIIECGLREINEALANARNTTSGKPGKAVVTSFDN